MTPLQSYHIALIHQDASSNGTHQPPHALLNRSVPYYVSHDRSSSYSKAEGREKEESGARRLTSLHAPSPETASAAFRPTFEIEINEEDDRNLPKRLLQACINKQKNNQSSSSSPAPAAPDGISLCFVSCLCVPHRVSLL